MTDWERVKEELQETDYPGFEFDSGKTAVPGLSGEWVVGRIAHENQPLLAVVANTVSLFRCEVETAVRLREFIDRLFHSELWPKNRFQ